MSELLFNSHKDPQLNNTIYNSMYTAYDIARRLIPEDVTVSSALFDDLCGRGLTRREVRDKIEIQSRAYLSERPHLSQLISELEQYIDPDGSNGDTARTIAGYTIMCIEMQCTDVYIEEQVKAFSNEIEEYSNGNSTT